MSVLDLVNYGNPILRKKCNQVTNFPQLSDLIDDMFDTMYEEEGIGLAANQVGIDLNLFIIDISHTDDDEYPRIFINGEITSSRGESVFSEGCLSIPKVALEVTRPEVILFKYQDIHEEWYDTFQILLLSPFLYNIRIVLVGSILCVIPQFLPDSIASGIWLHVDLQH